MPQLLVAYAIASAMEYSGELHSAKNKIILNRGTI
jgi:hypothetical protein